MRNFHNVCLVAAKLGNNTIKGLLRRRLNNAMLRKILLNTSKDVSLSCTQSHRTDCNVWVAFKTVVTACAIRTGPLVGESAIRTKIATATAKPGKAIEKGGFSNGTSRISIHNESGEAREYTLQIKGGLTKSSDKPWKVSVQETWVWTSPISVSVGRTVVLYPQVPSRFYWSLAATPPKVPTGGFVNYGELRFHDGASNERWLTLPMRLK